VAPVSPTSRYRKKVLIALWVCAIVAGVVVGYLTAA